MGKHYDVTSAKDLDRVVREEKRMATREEQKQREREAREARRQTASNIVNGQPMVGGMRIMDGSSEEVLKAVLSVYEPNEARRVYGDGSVIPLAYHTSLNLEFEKLENYGMISNSAVYVGPSWAVTLTPQGLSYFEDKENAERREESLANKLNTNRKEFDVFISHANKDKSDYVDSLYMAIRRLGVNIFYDTEVLSWGDKWKQVILEGTEKSEFAIIVISENFFGREWTERELNEFLHRQNASGQKIVLPLLHNITLEKLKEHYPELGDIQVIDTDRYTKEEIVILFAKELIKRLKV